MILILTQAFDPHADHISELLAARSGIRPVQSGRLPLAGQPLGRLQS